ncbi:MAG: AAA domain-containing protein [Planctomycetaceae bacterium]
MTNEIRKRITATDIDQMMANENLIQSRFLHRLENSSVEKNVASGEVLGPLRVVGQDHRNTYLETTAFYSRFRKGDGIQIRASLSDGISEHVCSQQVKEVTYPSEGKIRIALGKPRNVSLGDGGDLFMFPAENSYMSHRLRETVAMHADTLHSKRSPVKLGKPFNTEYSERLNDSQAESLSYLFSEGTDSAVQGPPGTGKTQLLQAIVAQAMHSGLTIGIAAFTHTAVDNALSRVAGINILGEFTRIGKKDKIDLSKYDLGNGRIVCADSFSQAPASRLYAATTHSWTLSETAPKVDLLIIDEAAQVPVYFLAPLQHLGRRIICLGDHKQLPPVLKGDHNTTIATTEIFSCFTGAETPMLDIQYRMNATIQNWPSCRFYDGELQPDASVENRDILSGSSSTLGSAPLQLISHKGGSARHADPVEASGVADVVGQLFRESDKLQAEQIGIISPHRMHNGAIIRALQSSFGVELASRIQVDTVERYQGQEREVILFSFGTTPKKSADVDFLGDAKRLNVAVTRARSRVYCFASDTFTKAFAAQMPDEQTPKGHLASFFASFRQENGPELAGRQ